MEFEQVPKLEKVKVYSIVTLILVIFGSGVSIWVANRIDFYTSALVHTEEVLQRNNELYANILERETSIRGYILTGNEEFLANYESSKLTGKEIFPYLFQLTSDNETQQKYLKEIQAHIQTRLEIFEQSKKYYQENGDLVGFLSPEKIENSINGYRAIKGLINKINEEESQLIIERNKILINNIAALPLIIGLISFMSVLMGALTLFSIFHFNKATKIKDEKIRISQELLKDKIEQLNESNDELKQFAYIASHDLQEPLRKITSFSDLLKEQYQGKLDEEGNHYLARISASAYRMRRLITDLLEYSRAGRDSDENVKKVFLDEVVNSVIDDMEVAINEKNAIITFQNLPVVDGKETEFRQVFQNLLSNSLKFAKKETIPQITISTAQAPQELIKTYPQLDQSIGYFLIILEDNGIGFDQSYAERIFTIFQRLHGKNEFEGTGIGLSITRKIIENYGGVISAEGIVANGATFKIVLPKPSIN